MNQEGYRYYVVCTHALLQILARKRSRLAALLWPHSSKIPASGSMAPMVVGVAACPSPKLIHIQKLS